MNRRERELVEGMLECLHPFCRAYIDSLPAAQLALNEWHPIKMLFLRDAYLMHTKVRQLLSRITTDG